MAEFLGTNTQGGNENKSFMHSTYDDNKLSKSKELNNFLPSTHSFNSSVDIVVVVFIPSIVLVMHQLSLSIGSQK